MEGFQSPQVDSKPKINEKIDYSNLPCPVPYQELNREAAMALKLDIFEGFRFDYVKTVNQKFGLSHGVSMGPTELPPELCRGATQIIKIPTSSYEFGAHFLDPKLLLVGRIMTDGRQIGRLKYDFTDNLSIKSNLQLTNEQDATHANVTFDYKGSDYRTQVQLGSDSQYTANYIQHVTPQLSLGGDIFYVKNPEKRSGVGFGARYENDKMVASAKVYSTGVAFMDYVHKVSEKLSFAADFMYNHALKDVAASVGYDYIVRQCRLRGKIDSNGVVAVHLDERLSNGLGILLSAEVDHVKKDYKFGLGFNINLS